MKGFRFLPKEFQEDTSWAKKPVDGISKLHSEDLIGGIEKDFGVLNRAEHKDPEQEMVEHVDEKGLLLDLMREMLPIFKRVNRANDAETIMQVSAVPAAQILFKNLLFGSERAQGAAAKEILDRALGRPIERQMNLNANVNSLPNEEVNREIARIIRKLGPEGFRAITRKAGPGGTEDSPQGTHGGGAAVGVGAARPVPAEQSSETVPGEPGENSGVNRGK